MPIIWLPSIDSMSLTLGRSLFPALATLLLVGPLAGTAAAQDDRVYPISEFTNPPKLSSSVQAARLISESYPANLKSRGVGGMVELQFVVDSMGKLEAGSVGVVDATQTALGEAAKKAVTKLEFSPGTLNGAAVKTKVVLPIIYKP